MVCGTGASAVGSWLDLIHAQAAHSGLCEAARRQNKLDTDVTPDRLKAHEVLSLEIRSYRPFRVFQYHSTHDPISNLRSPRSRTSGGQSF